MIANRAENRILSLESYDKNPNIFKKMLYFYGHMPREKLRHHQLEKLRALVNYHYLNNSIYREMCEQENLIPADIKSLDDLQKLPIVERDFLSKYSFSKDENGFLSLPISQLATFLSSSGSTGKSKRIPIARSALPSIFQNIATGFLIAGIKSFDEGLNKGVLPIFPHGPWPSSFFAQNACELISFAPKADSHMPFRWHMDMLLELPIQAIVTSPSIIFAFSNFLEDNKVDLPSLKLERILLAGEYFSESFREHIESKFATKVRDVYGCGETQMIGVESDALFEQFKGCLYHLADMSIIEVVKPGTNEILPSGEKGEMLITVFNRYEWPVIRYRVGDLVEYFSESNILCKEYQFPIMSRIKGRSDDMLVYGNVNIYPELLFNALRDFNIAQKIINFPRLNNDRFQFIIADQIESGMYANANLIVEIEENIDIGQISEQYLHQAKEKLLKYIFKHSNELYDAVTVSKHIPPPNITFVNKEMLSIKESKLCRMIDKRIKR